MYIEMIIIYNFVDYASLIVREGGMEALEHLAKTNDNVVQENVLRAIQNLSSKGNYNMMICTD
jgi:hypothetical protein